MPDSPYPSGAPDHQTNAHVPPWISVFILFGALGALIVLFALACWFARSVLGRAPPLVSLPAGGLEANRAESDEVIAQKMQQLDESAPAKTYKEWREASGQVDDGTKTGVGVQTNAYIVCSICLDTLEDQDVIRQLSCQHTYHSECIVKWYMKKHDTCPLCKTYYVPHDETVAVPRRAHLNGRGPRDDAILRFYQTVSV